jgi:hypothetical protein
MTIGDEFLLIVFVVMSKYFIHGVYDAFLYWKWKRETRTGSTNLQRMNSWMHRLFQKQMVKK